jgi:hypothetical protein
MNGLGLRKLSSLLASCYSFGWSQSTWGRSSMSSRTITALFILGTALVITGYDFAVYFAYGRFSTISDVTRWAGAKWPLLPPLLAFALGCLYGHIFLTPDTGTRR